MNIDLATVTFLLLKLLWIQCLFSSQHDLGYNRDNTDVYTNKWVVHIKDGEEIAKKIAEEHNFIYHGQVGSLEDYYHLEHRSVSRRSRRSADEYHTLLSHHPDVLWFEQQIVKKRVRREYFSDPLFNQQWYLKNDGQTYERCKRVADNKLDINVIPAWDSNVTGKDVVVTIVDDGLEYTHPDLKRNYDPQASYDYNSNDNDPFPRYSANNINKHGTRCAGIVGAEINNGICGAGVAFNAKVGGIRMLDGQVTDGVEASSLSYKREYIDIYSNSWGPDDGYTLEGPARLAEKAFRDGVKHGRKGLGSIFVWATGNGGRDQDYCSCDGYVNSPYTISIGAVDNCGRKPWYAEECPGTLAVTYSSGGTLDKRIVTTDLRHRCTTRFSGTSAAAPLAAGIFALVLEANQHLTWRDMQHLIVKTSKVITKSDPNWQTNGVGHKVNPKFGFGALDAGNLVKYAASSDWKTALPQRICETNLMIVEMDLKKYGSIETSLNSDGCVDLQNCVTKLEHVRLIMTLVKSGDRGKLDITLTSPSGTRSAILRKRPRDTSRAGFKDWAFLTVFHWDEKPNGTWKLRVDDNSVSYGKLISWKLKFYGTCENNSGMIATTTTAAATTTATTAAATTTTATTAAATTAATTTASTATTAATTTTATTKTRTTATPAAATTAAVTTDVNECNGQDKGACNEGKDDLGLKVGLPIVLVVLAFAFIIGICVWRLKKKRRRIDKAVEMFENPTSSLGGQTNETFDNDE